MINSLYLKKIDLKKLPYVVVYKMTTITDINTVNVDTAFKYLPVRVNSAGGKSVGIQNKNFNKKVVIRTPLMLTWGLGDYEGNEKFQFSLQFPGNDFLTPKTKKLLDQMKAFEDKLKGDVIVNSKEWLGKAKMTPEVLDALWTPMLKYPKTDGEPDNTKSPTLSVKTPRYDNKWGCEIYNPKGELVFDPNDTETTKDPRNYITKGCFVACVIECGGLWVTGGKCGVTWRLIQAAVKPKETLAGKCHITLDDDELATLETEVEKIENEEESSALVSTEVESDGEEEQEEEEEEEEEEPETVFVPPVVEEPKKKVVRKKASTSRS
jgi:hypothetical protein